MKRGTKKITSLALALTMCLSSLAGSAFAAEPETELMEEEIQLTPSLFCDKDIIEVADAETPLETELTISSPDAVIDGTITAKDITLSGAFKDMEVESVSNDETTVTLKLSGTPDMTRETYSIPVLGKMEFAGEYFGSEIPVGTSVELAEAATGDGDVTTIFWPYFDGVLDNKDTWEMHIILMPVGGEFVEDFNESFLSFGYDLEGVKMTSFKENEGNYEIIITMPKGDKEEKGYDYIGSITLAKGSMVKRNGDVVDEELSVTRDYTPETTGKIFSPIEIGQLKDIVGGFGNTTAGTITGIISGGGSVFSAGWMMLGLLGYVPNDASRHAEVMGALTQIQAQLNQIQSTINTMRGILNEHTLMLNDLKITTDEFYLNDIGGDMIILTSLMTEITSALNTRANKKAIEEILKELQVEFGDKFPEDYNYEDAFGRDMDPEELALLAAAEDDDAYVDDFEEEDAEDFAVEEAGDEFDEPEVMPEEDGEGTLDEDDLGGLIEEMETEGPEPVEDTRTQEEKEEDFAEFQEAFSLRIGALRQSGTFTIAMKIRDLKTTYDQIVKKFQTNNSSNPINAYIDVHKLTDNFATTSLYEKVMYAETIKYELNRALVMLEVLDGVRSHKPDRTNFRNCIFPDPTIGVTDADGNPWCYLMNHYVRLSGGEITSVYYKLRRKPDEFNETNWKKTILIEEKANDFAARMHGRTCREELSLAGFTDAQMEKPTLFQEKDLMQNRRYNVNHVGLTFEYGWDGCYFGDYVRRIFKDDKDLTMEELDNNPWEGFEAEGLTDYLMGARYLEHFASHLGGGFDGYYPRAIGEFGNESVDSIAIVSKGIGWEETEMGDFSVDVIYNYQTKEGNKKLGRPTTYKGWGVFYPKQYLVELGDKYLTK